MGVGVGVSVSLDAGVGVGVSADAGVGVGVSADADAGVGLSAGQYESLKKQLSVQIARLTSFA